MCRSKAEGGARCDTSRAVSRASALVRQYEAELEELGGLDRQQTRWDREYAVEVEAKLNKARLWLRSAEADHDATDEGLRALYAATDADPHNEVLQQRLADAEVRREAMEHGDEVERFSMRKRWGRGATEVISVSLSPDERLFEFDRRSPEQIKAALLAEPSEEDVPSPARLRELARDVEAAHPNRLAAERRRARGLIEAGQEVDSIPGMMGRYQPDVTGRKAGRTGAAKNAGRFDRRSGSGARAKVMLSEHEYAEVERRASEFGLPLSEYARRRLLGVPLHSRQAHQGHKALKRMSEALHATFGAGSDDAAA